jgi:hypothetical protein
MIDQIILYLRGMDIDIFYIWGKYLSGIGFGGRIYLLDKLMKLL